MLGRTPFELVATITLAINYAAAYVVTFVWDVPTPSLELALHIGIVLVASLLFGTLIADIKKTIVYTVVSVIMGIAIAMIAIIMPALILAEGPGIIDLYLSVGLSELSRLFIIGISFVVLGTLVGAFLAEAMK